MNPKDPEPTADGRRALLEHIPTRTGAAALARRFVADHLERWHVSSDAVSFSVLITSELIANAFEHGAPPVGLALSLHDGRIRIEVSDSSGGTPAPSRPSPTRLGGRGLWLVEKFGADWGWRREPPGKVVWSEVTDPVTPPEARLESPPGQAG